MARQQIQHLAEPSHIQDIGECTLETLLSWETENFGPPDSLENVVLHDDYMERLLEIETDLMGFSSADGDSVMGLDRLDTAELTCEMIQETQGDGSMLTEENSILKKILEELMDDINLTDLLLMGAEAVEAQNWTLSSAIIAKLKDLLFDEEHGDNSFKRLAWFFTQGLHYKSVNASAVLHQPISRQPADTMPAFQVLQEVSPYVKFAHFTANQAILEATLGDQEIHIIDFDILEGIQWPPLMVDLVTRKNASLKITAIIGSQQHATMVQQTGRRLKEYADSINLSFVFEQMEMVSEDDFESLEVGHALVANCMIHQLYMANSSFSMVKTFLSGMSRLSPKILVLAQEELFNFAKIPAMSFVEFFCEALHHYNAICDSLVSSCHCGYKVGLKLMEEFLGTRILDTVSQFPFEEKESLLWGNGFSLLKGFRSITFSPCNVSQANFIVNLFSGGYWVRHEKCKLTLCWKTRPLTTVSVWVPNIKNRVR